MKFEDIVKKVECYLENPNPMQMLPDNEMGHLNDTFKMMTHDISELIGGKELEHNNDKFSKVMGAMLILSTHLLEGPLNDDFGSFVVFYSEIAFNWNKFTANDPVIKNLALHISRLSETRTAMVKCINAIKQIDRRLSVLSSWSPPSYDISKAYFEELLKQNEKESK